MAAPLSVQGGGRIIVNRRHAGTVQAVGGNVIPGLEWLGVKVDEAVSSFAEMWVAADRVAERLAARYIDGLETDDHEGQGQEEQGGRPSQASLPPTGPLGKASQQLKASDHELELVRPLL
mmetsp:Transcript_40990/g.130250  ORF Transcript_40990/g.130250 Transcript_40990/m.130250 type:complete len:120 (+) Transcript_40990:89-448(+)